MIAGVVWALIGLALCEITHRGKVTTTIVTAAAGALGVGAKAARSAPASSAVFVVAGIGVAALALLVFLALTLGNRGPRRHGSAAIASTRQVLYHEGRNRPIHQGKARPDRTRGSDLK